MWYEYKNDVIRLNLYIQPGAKSNEISGLHDGALKIRLNAPPIEGRANEALIKYLAKCFDVPSKQIKLIRGEKSRRKTFEITGSLIDPSKIVY
ncbi:MAG: YggU family protein [Legionella sp.]|nr:MAG: YggU family protein [Legionella sp.]PJD99745.1 MAG: YggU family protein [Legionella sp.]